MATPFTTMRWLRRYASKNGQQVFIRVRMRNGFETEIPIYDYVNNSKVQISVKKEHWNKGHVTGGRYHIPIRDLNNLLAKVEADVKDAVNMAMQNKVPITRENLIRLTYINELTAEENERKIATGEVIVDEQGGAFASQDEFEEFVETTHDPKFDKLKKILGVYSNEYILDYWDGFIKDFAPDSYNSPYNSIEEYIKETGNNCKASEFSDLWLQQFFKHIIENGYSFRKDGTNRQQYLISTIKKYNKHLRHFGDYLFNEIKVLDNQNYRRFKLKEKVKKKSLIKYDSEQYINNHALYKKEFDYFYGFHFDDKELETVRNMFVLQVWLGGLRQVDFYNLSKINFHKDSHGKYRVWFEQEKTEGNVLNVANQNYLIPILEKYPYGFKDFPIVNDYNKLLKVAAKTAGLNRSLKFRKEYVKDSQATIIWHPIYEKISNKWARNCAVSILAELAYPDDWIAKFTGHKDLEMIKYYKQIHQKEVDSMLSEVHPEIISEL